MRYALKLATLYPAGSFELAEAIGCEALIERLKEAYEETEAELFKPLFAASAERLWPQYWSLIRRAEAEACWLSSLKDLSRRPLAPFITSLRSLESP